MDDQPERPKKSIKEWLIKDLYDDFRTWRGLLIGSIVGYIASYYSQSDMLTSKVSLGRYLMYFYDVLFRLFFDPDKASIEIGLTAWTGVIIGGLVGILIEKRIHKKQ